ncbi:MAG: hypothetical protein D6803_07995, partial [Anaerolineae bacterium]
MNMQKTWATWVREEGKWSPDRVVEAARQVADILAERHRTTHGRWFLSPEAVVIDAEGRVSVRAMEGAPPEYVAPELRAGGQPTAAADFYALGAVMYFALTGEPPAAEIEDPFPGNKVAGIPPELDELVARCLARQPERRVQSAAEFLSGLEEIQKGEAMAGRETLLDVEDQLLGRTIGGYQLVERLGQGGMATVYKAYEAALDRYVAVKVLPDFFAKDPTFAQRFRREARAVAQLNHPSILPIYNFGSEGGVTYIAMQYVEGGTLKQKAGQVYAPLEAVRLVLPVARALAYAHRRGVIHRDVKPANVLISEDGWPILADFGLARMVEASTQLTGTGVGIGTPAYMSPEQGRGEKVDHRADIYSLGIMLYEMLTGDVPFKADTPMGVVLQHISAPLPPPRKRNPDIPESLERIILKATAKKPEERYQSADEMIAALEAVERELTARQAGDQSASLETSHSAGRARRGRAAGWLVGAVALLAVLIVWASVACPWPWLPWCEAGSAALFASPSPTPTLPVTSVALGDILFQDVFKDKAAADWVFIPEDWKVVDVDGRHAIRSPASPDGAAADLRLAEWQDYAVAFDFRFEQPDQFGEYHFFLRGRINDCPSESGNLQSYQVRVSPNKVDLNRETCDQGAAQEMSLSG